MFYVLEASKAMEIQVYLRGRDGQNDLKWSKANTKVCFIEPRPHTRIIMIHTHTTCLFGYSLWGLAKRFTPHYSMGEEQPNIKSGKSVGK